MPGKWDDGSICQQTEHFIGCKWAIILAAMIIILFPAMIRAVAAPRALAGVKVTVEELASICIKANNFHGDWKHTIRPRG